jgi:hypothetical protein
MSILNIYVGRSGIERVTATVRTISESSVAAELMQVASLPIRLLSDSVRDHFAGKVATHDAAADADATDATDPAEELDVYVCACGSRFHSAGEAVDHIEADHASPRIREDLDKLEDTIEVLITPCPLAPVSEEVFPVRSWRSELTKEIARIFANINNADENVNREPTQEHFDRAIKLVNKTGWGDLQDWDYMNLKRQILAEGKTPAPASKRIKPKMHEDFLSVFGVFVLQVRRADRS